MWVRVSRGLSISVTKVIKAQKDDHPYASHTGGDNSVSSANLPQDSGLTFSPAFPPLGSDFSKALDWAGKPPQTSFLYSHLLVLFPSSSLLP